MAPSSNWVHDQVRQQSQESQATSRTKNGTCHTSKVICLPETLESCIQRRQVYNRLPSHRRPSKLEEKQIKVATEIFAAGFKQRGSDVSMPFSSFNQALRLSKQLAKIVSTAKVHPKTLWRAIKASKPTLKQRSLEIYQPLSESQKQARLEACQTFIDMPRRMLKLLLRRIVWIDAAKIWVSVDKNNKVWVDTSSESTLLVPDHRAAGKRCPKVCLAYYAAVNSEIGPVYFGLTSGTQGLLKLRSSQQRYNLNSFIILL